MMKYSPKKRGSPPLARISFTHIATRSKPKDFRFLASTAILSLVPTPSVLLNKIGSLYFNLPKSKIDAKPPGF